MPDITAAPAAEPKKRIGHLDSMRGMCILLVNYFHSNISLMFLQYTSAICVHPFFFMAGYFYNDSKPLSGTLHKKLRTMIFPYYVLGLMYYVLWLLMFMNSGRDLVTPLRSVLYMPTGDFPIEASIYFLPMMFCASMIFALIIRYIRKEPLRLLVICALTLLGNLWTTLFTVRLPMGLDCSIAVLIYIYVGYHGRTIIAFFDRFVESIDSHFLRVMLFFTAAVINYILIISNYIPNLRNGVWSNIPFTHFNTCTTMLLWVYFFRWFDKPRLLAPIRAALKYVGENSMIFMCFSHIGLYIGLFAVNHLPLSGTAYKIMYYIIGTVAVVPIVILFKKTKLHALFGK